LQRIYFLADGLPDREAFSMNRLLLKKLLRPHIWRRIGVERLTEPLHLNLVSLFVALFGSFRAKVAFDLVVRQHAAYCLLRCADQARARGLRSVTAVEFGVASGAGLFNMAEIASQVTLNTGIEFKIIGFDTARGMPPPVDYRDHPDLYREGDFRMDEERLRQTLPANVELVIGDLKDTAQTLLKILTPESPLGYVCLDVDFYSSTKHALTCLTGEPDLYLPVTYVYLDDLEDEAHNSNCGELLALSEFNREVAPRIVERHTFLRGYRIMKNARWIDHIFAYHVVDHPSRAKPSACMATIDLENPYLR
jgi:hypothetical protein